MCYLSESLESGDRDDQDQSEDTTKDKHAKSEKGTNGRSKVRYMNAIAIAPDDLLSARDNFCNTVNDDVNKMNLATVTEQLFRGKPLGKSHCTCNCQ